MRLVMDVAEHVIVLERGRLLAEGGLIQTIRATWLLISGGPREQVHDAERIRLRDALRGRADADD